MERHSEQLDVNGTAAVAMGDTSAIEREVLIALAYGTRARLADLQRTPDRELTGRAGFIADANRFLRRVDEHMLRRATTDPIEGWAIFDAIKATRDGSVQRLSQQLREKLPDRSIVS